MKSLTLGRMLGAMLLSVLSVLPGCGSEGEQPTSVNAAINPGHISGAFDSRTTIHAGVLQNSESTNSGVASPYVLKGCYQVTHASCPGHEDIANSIMSGEDSGFCFEHINNDYYMHLTDWKVPVTLSTDVTTGTQNRQFKGT